MERLNHAIRLQGRDKQGRKILLVVGKHFPARFVNQGELKQYLVEKVFPLLDENPRFCLVYVHSLVQRNDNFPGISTLRWIYEEIPNTIKEKLGAVYFVHPGLQSRLFFATLGRFLFSKGLYGKFQYINRLEFLWEHVRKGEVKIPEFVYEHDDDLERRPLMDYGFETDRRGFQDAPTMDATPSMHYSLRCIS